MTIGIDLMVAELELAKLRISQLEDALVAGDKAILALAEQLDHRNGVIEALQQNIADLTLVAPQQPKSDKLPRYF